MRVIILSELKTTPAIAQVYHNKTKGQLYYNIRHGAPGVNFGYWLGMISPSVAIPKDINDILTMDDDSYTLSAHRKNGETVTDKLGNVTYTINKDFSSMHKNDTLLLWEIPNKEYVDVRYSISGNAKEIGIGYNGKDRGDVVYKSPAPVVEVYGKAILAWTAINVDGEMQTQTIHIDQNGAFNIETIKVIKKIDSENTDA